MKRVLAAAAVAMLISTFVFADTPKKSDEELIRARAQEFADAWNKHDATAMAYFWSVDGDLVNPFGRRASGLTEIQRLFADEQSKAMKDTTYTVTAVKVRFLNPTTAVVDQDVEVANIASPDGTAVTMKPHIHSVMTKSGGQWWIASARAFAYMQPPPPPAAPK
ncbi:MAG TPA: nuclear transport factor 2 family protein [Thermoanaerobaculia bacterium]